MKKLKLFLLAFVLFLSLGTVEAKEVNHFTTNVGDDVIVKDIYNSSVAAAGETIDFTGTVNGIAIGAANEINISGTSEYGIFAGNEITLTGTVEKDTYIAGNIITTEETSLFQRDFIVAGNDIKLNGNFSRNVSVYGNKVTIENANIKGNLKIYSTSIKVKDGAVVEGTLSYPEDSVYKVSSKAQINEVKKTAAIQQEDDENYLDTVSGKFFTFLCYALIFAAISLFLPNAFTNINDKYAEFTFGEGVEVFTKGLVIFILVPVISVILLITMIGLPLGIILLILYGIAIYVSKVFTAYLIGYNIWQKAFDKDAHIIFFGIIGLFVLLLLDLIPGVRTLATIFTVLIGLGLIFDVIKKNE